jgi:hypothetical protein
MKGVCVWKKITKGKVACHISVSSALVVIGSTSINKGFEVNKRPAYGMSVTGQGRASNGG